jgi:hypothetical protein
MDDADVDADVDRLIRNVHHQVEQYGILRMAKMSGGNV